MTGVIDWVSDSDPYLGWQVLAGLAGAPPNGFDAERSWGASEGWGLVVEGYAAVATSGLIGRVRILCPSATLEDGVGERTWVFCHE